MIAVIAEKPSVAADIAKIIGATQRFDGYLSGNGYMVTWAFGHLIQLAMPDAYGVTTFRRDHLPIIPTAFQLIPRQIKFEKGYKSDPGVLKQLKVIKEVFGKCDSIVVATDAGREGELIFRYIYNYLKCRKPFRRLWISSLTDKAIREGMHNLQPGERYDNLYLSAKSRSEADWLIGINATQSLSVAAGKGIYSLGRVQTPTLKMICTRYLENKNFIPVKYWQLKVNTTTGGIDFSVQSVSKWEQETEATVVLTKVRKAGQLLVKAVEQTENNQEPPLLYDLTSLQKDANTKLNFSADKTLSLAQSLYEKKVLSYPRTGSRYISEDVYDEIPERISLLTRYPRFAEYAKSMAGTFLNKRSVNDGKVTDHHALIITENLPGNLSNDERAIYELVAGRMLEAFSGKCIKDVTTVVLSADDCDFMTKGSVIKAPGWRTVFNAHDSSSNDENNDNSLPQLHQGEVLPLSRVELLEKQTKPKPLHTESSLLAAMENASMELEDADIKARMKDCGIGTPATRAAIIETLFSRQYIVREKKNLVPTEKGLTVFNIVKDKKISDVELTGIWENDLFKIETGELSTDSFHKGIEDYVVQITNELLSIQIEVKEAEGVECPKCKAKTVHFYPKVVKCLNGPCGFVVFRNKCDKVLTNKQITDLLTKKKTGVIKGFKSKAGKSFDASLVLDDKFNVTFQFADNKTNQRKIKKE